MHPKISLAEFLAKIKDSKIATYDGLNNASYYTMSKKDDLTPECYLKIEWVTGGEQGGSCWDTGEEDPHYPLDAEIEPEFESLDQTLELICPNISFLDYKKVVRGCVDTEDRVDREYYGNYTNYARKQVKLGSLYDTLLKLELL